MMDTIMDGKRQKYDEMKKDEKMQKKKADEIMDIMDEGGSFSDGIDIDEVNFFDRTQGMDSCYDEFIICNKADELFRRGKIKEAIELCVNGLQVFDNNIDLIACVIGYSSMCDFDIADVYFKKLSNTYPRKLWTSKAYKSVLEFLMKNPQENEKLCRDIIADFKKWHPFNENSYTEESELERKLGNYEKSRQILEQAVNNIQNAPECAFRLIEIQLKRGEFEEAIRTSDYFGIASCTVGGCLTIPCCEEQSPLRVVYSIYLRCLIEDALLRKKSVHGEGITKEEVDKVRYDYEKAMRRAEIRICFGTEIEDRITLLDFVETMD